MHHLLYSEKLELIRIIQIVRQFPNRINVQFAFAVKRFKLTDVDLNKSPTSLSTQATHNRLVAGPNPAGSPNYGGKLPHNPHIWV